MCVVGTAEEGQYDPDWIQGPIHQVLERSGSEIQDGQLGRWGCKAVSLFLTFIQAYTVYAIAFGV